MLDKSIPYHDILMRRSASSPLPTAPIPAGFSWHMYSPGDEQAWADIETSVGEFDSVAEALTCFQKNYAIEPLEAARRVLFLQTPNSEMVATLTVWWEQTGERRDCVLHWVGVKPAHQNLGLGKALVAQGLRLAKSLEGNVDVYLHSQTWSYRAIGIYRWAGFSFLTSETFGHNKNEFEQARPILQQKWTSDIPLV